MELAECSKKAAISARHPQDVNILTHRARRTPIRWPLATTPRCWALTPWNYNAQKLCNLYNGPLLQARCGHAAYHHRGYPQILGMLSSERKRGRARGWAVGGGAADV